MNLQDCELISKEISYGELGIYGDMGYEIIPSVNGILYQNIISAHPDSTLVYKIPENTTYFSCKIALNDSSEEFSSCNFEIYVDKELRFSSQNLGKFVLSHVEIILDDNSEIELICKIQNKLICHGLWIDAQFTEKPKYILDSIRKTKIHSIYYKQKYENVVVSYLDTNFIKYAKTLKDSITKNTSSNIKFVYLIEDKQDLINFCLENDAIYIQISDIQNKDISQKGIESIYHKASTYSIAKFVNAENYIILDLDMICVSNIQNLIERINVTNDEILVCKDSHTEGLSFGDLIVSSWSAYKGNKNCKHILNLNESELKSQLIINSGLIAGKKKAILSIEDQIKRLSPISLYYLDENKNPVREQALFNLALIKYNKYQILHKKYNLQAIWEEILIESENNEVKAYSEDFSPCLIHFNGPDSKKILNEIIDNLETHQKFKINRIKSGRKIAEKINKNYIQILDVQNDDGIINSFIKTTQCKSYRIEKIYSNHKSILNSFETAFSSPIEDQFIELKNNKNKYDAVIVSNLDNIGNCITKLSLCLSLVNENGLVIFNQYDNEIKLEEIISRKEDLKALKLNETIEENPIQKIYIMSK